VFDGVLLQAVVLDFEDGLPVQYGRVLDDIEGRFRRTVKNDVQPIVLFETLGGVVLVGGEGHFARDCPPPVGLDTPAHQLDRGAHRHRDDDFDRLGEQGSAEEFVRL
jgi:hypothetical protein